MNYILSKRLELLNEVERLQQSLGVIGDVAYTCETAADFFLYQVHARWEAYLRKIKKRPNQEPVAVEEVGGQFPFNSFFANAPQPLFKVRNFFDKPNEFIIVKFLGTNVRGRLRNRPKLLASYFSYISTIGRISSIRIAADWSGSSRVPVGQGSENHRHDLHARGFATS